MHLTLLSPTPLENHSDDILTDRGKASAEATQFWKLESNGQPVVKPESESLVVGAPLSSPCAPRSP